MGKKLYTPGLDAFEKFEDRIKWCTPSVFPEILDEYDLRSEGSVSISSPGKLQDNTGIFQHMHELAAEAYGNILAALKPGGSFIVVDTQAKDGSGPETGRTIHRLAPDLMRRELEGAGFKFVDSGDFIQNPDDPLDIGGRQIDGTPSAFVHRYIKPE